jgi:hypothetical protein
MSFESDPSARESRSSKATSSQSEDFPNLREGVRAGVIGASIVAIFFLLIDLAAGRPLGTPNALGAALFLGEPIDLSRSLSATLILGYTGAHGTVFVGIASVAAALLLGSRRAELGVPGMLATWLALLVACEIFFLALTLVADFSTWSTLGAGRVAVANGLAAAGMTASLVYGLRRVAAES